MGVFFGFGNAQLGFAVVGQQLAQAVVQGFRRIGHERVDAVGVLGGHDKTGECRLLAAGETIEVAVDKGAGNFPGAVGAEVHKDNRVTVVNRAAGLAVGLNNRGGDKFVVLVALVGGGQCLSGTVVTVLAFRFGQQAVGFFYAVPAVISVHGVIATDH